MREHRTHGSMRRREATNASRLARATEEPSRRPYAAAVSTTLPLFARSSRRAGVAASGVIRPPGPPHVGGRRWSKAAPELAATRRPLRQAKRQPLIEDRDVRPRDLHVCARPRPCLLEIDGSANGDDCGRASAGRRGRPRRDDWFRRQERAAVPTLAVSCLEQTNHAFRSCGVRYRSVSGER